MHNLNLKGLTWCQQSFDPTKRPDDSLSWPLLIIDAASASAGTSVAPVGRPAFTVEMAREAAKSCSKCRQQGCAQCMKEFFIPRKLIRQWSRESGGSAASAEPAPK